MLVVLSDDERDYIYGLEGLPLAHIDTQDQATWYCHDQIGSTRLLTNTSGVDVGSYRYEAYGLELATLEWVDWFNHRRLYTELGRIPPAELEDRYYRQEHSGHQAETHTPEPA